MRSFFAIVLAVLAACLFLAVPGAMAGAMNGPSDAAPASPASPAARAADPAGADFFVQMYQQYLSPVAGERCPMHPSCSAYARGALARDGALKGFIMACDRLLRCGRDETRLSPKVWVEGRPLTYDPVEANE
ncbi:MAG: membrane protein insertion efficiency factor YidD [Pseudomonadota bacterium]